MREYIDFLLNNGTPEPDDDAVFEAFLVPLAIGGNRNADNRVYLNAQDWAYSSLILMRYFSTLNVRKPERSHARLVLKSLPALGLPESDVASLTELCFKALAHSAGVLRPTRLYGPNGKEAFGTYAELVEQTGLEYNQVRDLVKKRRRWSGGWSATKTEAERGRLRPGRKPKPRIMATEGTPFF